MLAPGVELLMKDFHTSSEFFATFVVSIFVLGFACGPLLLAPLSELYGRVIVYNITNVLFLICTILCAVSQNAAMLLVFRFLSGFVGVATITIGSGTIADLMPREERGRAVSIWAVGSILGPIVGKTVSILPQALKKIHANSLNPGPVIGAKVAEAAGWRWIFFSISIVVSCVKNKDHEQ